MLLVMDSAFTFQLCFDHFSWFKPVLQTKKTKTKLKYSSEINQNTLTAANVSRIHLHILYFS